MPPVPCRLLSGTPPWTAALARAAAESEITVRTILLLFVVFIACSPFLLPFSACFVCFVLFRSRRSATLPLLVSVAQERDPPVVGRAPRARRTIGLTRSPRPSISTIPPSTSAGTSDPTSAPISHNRSFGNPNPHSSLRPFSTAAASADPPPKPAPTGMRLTMRIRTPRATPDASCNARAARTARFASHGTRGTSMPSPTISTVTSPAGASQSSTSSCSGIVVTTLRSSW